ncbi:MAG: hypothetical protein MJ000_00275 [Bacteroidales bacterium]|nr:hypothetical protein [Bacteroidales bacterium]
MKLNIKKVTIPNFFRNRLIEALIFLAIIGLFFGFLSVKMGTANMLNTVMQTAYHLLLETVFFLMAVCVLTGALGKLLVEFGVVRLVEFVLRPLMKPIYNLPGVAALGGILTFLSDNPAIITLSKDRYFSSYFKTYQLCSLTNFGTAFGMGLVVVFYMLGLGFLNGALVGLVGAIIGSIVSTRLMQRFTLKSFPQLDRFEMQQEQSANENISFKSSGNAFMRFLDSILDGGKEGVAIGLAIIPGVLIISTVVMMMTFGASGVDGSYTGAAYEGVPVLPYLAGKIDFVFKWLFGFEHPELVAFPITSLGAVGAALGLLPKFIAEGFIDNNAIAVCTAIGMCWSGFLSTHTAMLDSLGHRELISKAIGAHTIGGLVAGISAHWLYVLLALIF